MRWPWVSRRALDESAAEVKRLENRLAQSLRARERLLKRVADQQAASLADVARYEARLATMVDGERLTDAMGEIQYLRAKNDELVESITRIQRHQAGMPELPKAPKAELQPMPRKLFDYFNGMNNKRLAKSLRDQAYRANANGKAWDEIEAEVFQPAATEEEDGDYGVVEEYTEEPAATE